MKEKRKSKTKYPDISFLIPYFFLLCPYSIHQVLSYPPQYILMSNEQERTLG
jgi:hypothetical protein